MRLTQRAEHGTAEADRIPAGDLHIGAFRSRRFAQQFLAVQLEERALAERRLPDKSHNLSSHEGQGQKATDRRVLAGNCCNCWQRDHAIHRSVDGDSTLFRNVAQPGLRNKTRQQRYAATAHPMEGEAAKELAAM